MSTGLRPSEEIYDDLIAGLAVKPRVIECNEMVDALMEGPAKLHKGMAPQ